VWTRYQFCNSFDSLSIWSHSHETGFPAHRTSLPRPRLGRHRLSGRSGQDRQLRHPVRPGDAQRQCADLQDDHRGHRPTGALARAAVHAYVWPTSLDPATVGFEAGSGILALAATSHPDFDDTPLYDENADGDLANDGLAWHAHWVVLTPTDSCGPGALAVRDIPEGTTPQLPKTWPNLPLFIDSPDVTPRVDGPTITVTIEVPGAEGASFDGVTSALRVNADLHAPLLCVTDVFDVASGDLSLPGKID
jgi:hypothetical protein